MVSRVVTVLAQRKGIELEFEEDEDDEVMVNGDEKEIESEDGWKQPVDDD